MLELGRIDRLSDIPVAVISPIWHDWTGMTFRPALNPDAEAPLYKQLAGYVAKLIGSGELARGERLPATRELAGQLGINRTTVSAAYDLLEAEGLISGQVGRGSFVIGRAQSVQPDWDSILSPRPRRPQSTAAAISFAASRPSEELFPVDEFRKSCDEVLGSDRLGSILQLGSPAGYEPLRQYLLARAAEEGVLGPDDDLLITNGCQQALDLVRRVLVRPGVRVAMEDPVYPGLRNVVLESDAQPVSVSVGRDGLNLSELRESRARIAVITSNFQNPTGLSLSLSAREETLRIAQTEGIVLVENDMYSALRYTGEALPSLKQLNSAAGTVLLRSFSKVAFPGLRIGWVIAPRQLIAALRDAKQLSDLHSDQFSQAAMLRFAESGRLASHLAMTICAGRDSLTTALESAQRYLPAGSEWTRPEGGFNFWVTLPGGLDSAASLEKAQRRDVTYSPGEYFSVARPHTRALRLSFGGLAPDRIREGIQILGSIFEEELDTRRWADREPVPALV